METHAKLSWNAIPILICIAFLGWTAWRWLRSSDEPRVLIVRWILTVLVLMILWGGVSRGGLVLLIAMGFASVMMILLWRQKFCEYIADQFAALYTGGSIEPDAVPAYSIAEARRKQGRYLEAVEQIRSQLERFPTDFPGWMLLAETQAENLKDLAGAHQTIEELLAQGCHSPKNIAYALNREADWSLKLNHDRDAAQAALDRITQLLPDTEQAQLAFQRLAHLTPPEMLDERHRAQKVALPAGAENVGLRREPLHVKPPEEDPSTTAAKYVAHLEQHPYDNEAREKLALLYARHYQRLDLATDQLEQLIGYPNQTSKQVVHWLNLLADVQMDLAGDIDLVRQTLERIRKLYPKSAAAENTLNRIAYLKLELRQKQTSQAIKLDSYEQSLGLKEGWKKPRL